MPLKIPSQAEINGMRRHELKAALEKMIKDQREKNETASADRTLRGDGDDQGGGRTKETSILEELRAIRAGQERTETKMEAINTSMTTLQFENQQLLAEVTDLKQHVQQQHETIAILQSSHSKLEVVVSKQQGFLEKIDYERRGRNLIITGLQENVALTVDSREVNSDADKIRLILDSVGCTDTQPVSVIRLGNATTHQRIRPIKVVLESIETRNDIVSKSSTLADIAPLSKVFLKRDTHPAVREEWRRLHTVFKEEQKRPENGGCNMTFDKKNREILRDGVIIDKWNPAPFH